MKDIMSSMSKRLEIKRFVKDVLRSRVDYATRGDLDFSKDDLVSHGFGAFDQYWAPEASEDVNARYSFMTGESAAMDETVDSLAKEGDEAVKTLPPTYSYSRPIIEDTRYHWDKISSAPSTRLRDPIKELLTSNLKYDLPSKRWDKER
ncbi:hypothetical protein I308_106025 [Cryptococcus tetragattii IND107]|uniref:Uncharacterized protein n=1 Tax=Cryptococcus tetragattii IND107 TaxID=1296105 RepID=A0ABR3BLU7_9TREE